MAFDADDLEEIAGRICDGKAVLNRWFHVDRIRHDLAGNGDNRAAGKFRSEPKVPKHHRGNIHRVKQKFRSVD